MERTLLAWPGVLEPEQKGMGSWAQGANGTAGGSIGNLALLCSAGELNQVGFSETLVLHTICSDVNGGPSVRAVSLGIPVPPIGQKLYQWDS